MRNLLAAACATLALLLTAIPAAAQTSPLTGTVVDAQGAAVVGADVTLTTTGRTPQTVRSGAEGAFTFAGIPRGAYSLTVYAAGFVVSSQAITVDAPPSPVTVALQVAGLQEDVTVQAAFLGTAATGKTDLPLRELPMTVNAVPRALID